VSATVSRSGSPPFVVVVSRFLSLFFDVCVYANCEGQAAPYTIGVLIMILIKESLVILNTFRT